MLDKIQEVLKEDESKTLTENGAVAYSTTGTALLDLNFAVSNLRNAPDQKIYEAFEKAYDEDPKLALKWLFYCRDIKEGLGERRIFRVILFNLSINHPTVIKYLCSQIPIYGRYDDLFVLLYTTGVRRHALYKIQITLTEDKRRMEMAKASNQFYPVSLLAKWLPSINTSSKESRTLARYISEYIGLKPDEYRKLLSNLRQYIKVVERDMSANRWSEIDYEHVPSKANLIYTNAFEKHDSERRAAYYEQLKSGEKKVNAKALYPYEIIHKINSTNADILDEAWKSMASILPEYDKPVIVVRDGSYSMTSQIGKTKITALEVATSLAIYFSEKLPGEYKDKFITFSENPRFVDLSQASTIVEKYNITKKYDYAENTNVERVFDLVLYTAVKNNMKPEEIPDILVISDMEFDRCSVANDGNYIFDKSTLFDVISKKYEDNGYKLPRLIFWNVEARGYDPKIPMKENENGVILVSGFSTNIARMVMGDTTTPMEALINVLNSERYKNITAPDSALYSETRESFIAKYNTDPSREMALRILKKLGVTLIGSEEEVKEITNNKYQNVGLSGYIFGDDDEIFD